METCTLNEYMPNVSVFVYPDLHTHLLVFFSVTESRWSTDSVAAVELTREGNVVTVTCSSVHLTSFAVLVDVGGAQVSVYIAFMDLIAINMCDIVPIHVLYFSIFFTAFLILTYICEISSRGKPIYTYSSHCLQLDSEALRIVSYIGLAISLACLLLTIIFFLTFGYVLFAAGHVYYMYNVLRLLIILKYLIYCSWCLSWSHTSQTNVIVRAYDCVHPCTAYTCAYMYMYITAYCFFLLS